MLQARENQGIFDSAKKGGHLFHYTWEWTELSTLESVVCVSEKVTKILQH